MASLRFHKVSSLPGSCALGDVYYVEGKGIYVCTTAASSGATESANYTRFSYANDAASGVKGVTSLSDSVTSTSSTVAASSAAAKAAYDRGSKGVSDAADVQTNLTKHTSNTSNPHGVTKTQVGLGNVTNNAQVKGLSSGTTSGHFVAWGADGYTVADSGYAPGSFDTAGTAATEAGKVLGKSGDSASTATVYGVITKANALASRISSLEGKATTGMQYKGTTAAVPSSGKVGDVYKVTTAISTLGAEVGDFIVCRTATDGSTAATWDVWQANVENNAYFSALPTGGNYFLMSDGKNGALKASTFTSGSFDAKGAAAAVQTNLDNHTGNKKNPHGVTKAQVGLGNVTNDAQVKGLATGTTEGHFVTWGADGYTVTDSGKSANSFADKTHTHKSSDVTTMTGYAKASSAAAIATSDSLNVAIGKLEKGVEDAKSLADGKWAQKTATQANGGNAVEGTVIGYYASTSGFSKSPIIDGVVYYKDTDTHLTNTFTITNGTTAAQTFAQNANKSLAITASASGSLTASTSAGSGTLTVNVGVASGHVIPSDTQISQWDAKWDPVNATTSSKGIASFNSSNFSVSNGAVSLAWATWPE